MKLALITTLIMLLTPLALAGSFKVTMNADFGVVYSDTSELSGHVVFKKGMVSYAYSSIGNESSVELQVAGDDVMAYLRHSGFWKAFAFHIWSKVESLLFKSLIINGSLITSLQGVGTGLGRLGYIWFPNMTIPGKIGIAHFSGNWTVSAELELDLMAGMGHEEPCPKAPI